MVASNLDIALRLFTITALAGVIGIEREYHGKPAGLRTNVMVGLGSTLLTLASIRALDLFPNITSLDPTRITAQIIPGIGFIGAGEILRPSGDGANRGHEAVIGLTTAATLWVVSGLGIAVGMGLYYEALLTTLLVFFTFFLLGKIVNYVRHHSKIYGSHTINHADDPEEISKSTQQTE
jgi:putative Mg2+ transporter-C (MgtC) family protein